MPLLEVRHRGQALCRQLSGDILEQFLNRQLLGAEVLALAVGCNGN
jgi:hypothetical protein